MTVSLDPIGKRGMMVEKLTVITDGAEPVREVEIAALVTHGLPGQSSARLQATIFAPPCERCHGAPSAEGKSGPDLYDAVCAMCHPSAGELKTTGETELARWIAEGAPSRGMPAYAARTGGPLDEAGVRSLVKLIRERQAGR